MLIRLHLLLPQCFKLFRSFAGRQVCCLSRQFQVGRNIWNGCQIDFFSNNVSASTCFCQVSMALSAFVLLSRFYTASEWYIEYQAWVGTLGCCFWILGALWFKSSQESLEASKIRILSRTRTVNYSPVDNAKCWQTICQSLKYSSASKVIWIF